MKTLPKIPRKNSQKLVFYESPELHVEEVQKLELIVSWNGILSIKKDKENIQKTELEDLVKCFNIDPKWVQKALIKIREENPVPQDNHEISIEIPESAQGFSEEKLNNRINHYQGLIFNILIKEGKSQSEESMNSAQRDSLKYIASVVANYLKIKEKILLGIIPQIAKKEVLNTAYAIE